MKQLTLHVGTHKTGTTSLQRFILANADLLAEQGLYAPKTPSKYGHLNEDRTACFLRCMAHNELYGYYPEADFESMALSDALVVTKAIEYHDDVLLSDERIWYDAARHPEYWKAIRNVAENLGFDCFRIVVYLRRQEDLAVSLWEQFAKQTTMRRSLNDYLKSKRAISVLDYHTALKAMEDVFGHESIVIRIYDRNGFFGGDIFHDFCDALGLSWNDAFVIPDNLNQSLTFTAAEIKRIANSTQANRSSSNFLKEAALQLSHAPNTHSMKTLTSLSDEDFREFAQIFAEGNAAIARDFLGRDDGVLFEGEPAQQGGLDAFSPEMMHDMCYIFAEALAIEHDRNKALQKRIRKLEKHLSRLEQNVQAIQEAQTRQNHIKRFFKRHTSIKRAES